MTEQFLLDEHVPRVVETSMRSRGYSVERADELFGQGTDDDELLGACHERGWFLLTNDKKDYATLAAKRPHSGVFIYTSQNWARDEPGEFARAVTIVLDHYSQSDLVGEVVWLEQWRDVLRD